MIEDGDVETTIEAVFGYKGSHAIVKYILGDECEGKQHSLRISIGVESANNIFCDSMSI